MIAIPEPGNANRKELLAQRVYLLETYSPRKLEALKTKGYEKLAQAEEAQNRLALTRRASGVTTSYIHNPDFIHQTIQGLFESLAENLQELAATPPDTLTDTDLEKMCRNANPASLLQDCWDNSDHNPDHQRHPKTDYHLALSQMASMLNVRQPRNSHASGVTTPPAGPSRG